MISLLRHFKVGLLRGCSPLWASYLQLLGVKVGSDVKIMGRPGVNRKRGSIISIGNNATLCSLGMANPVAEEGRCRLATVSKEARLIIHDSVGMSSVLICSANHIEIGEGTQIGGGAMLLDTDFHPRLSDGSWGTDPHAVSEPVNIGKNCFIGARAIILKGVSIGDGSVVGAGAVVTKTVPPNSVAVGNPAKVVKTI
jgi:acetyltransferase-like isoleucine patch superfamily enzyme